jgi:hypothetical protein
MTRDGQTAHLHFNNISEHKWIQKLRKNRDSEKNRIGGESLIVGELSSVICFELESYPEPKALTQENLERLLLELGTYGAVVTNTGLGWSTVQERLRPSRRWNPKLKKFVKILK